MIQQRINSIVTIGTQYLEHTRLLCTTNTLCLNQKWRKERGLPLNPNRGGVLRDSPDYTFLDGRLTPCGMRQTQRILKQREVTKQIIHLTGEIDFAVDRHRQLNIDKSNQIKEILSRKLKPKGQKLLESKKN